MGIYTIAGAQSIFIDLSKKPTQMKLFYICNDNYKAITDAISAQNTYLLNIFNITAAHVVHRKSQ